MIFMRLNDHISISKNVVFSIYVEKKKKEFFFVSKLYVRYLLFIHQWSRRLKVNWIIQFEWLTSFFKSKYNFLSQRFKQRLLSS